MEKYENVTQMKTHTPVLLYTPVPTTTHFGRGIGNRSRSRGGNCRQDLTKQNTDVLKKEVATNMETLQKSQK